MKSVDGFCWLDQEISQPLPFQAAFGADCFQASWLIAIGIVSISVPSAAMCAAHTSAIVPLVMPQFRLGWPPVR